MLAKSKMLFLFSFTYLLSAEASYHPKQGNPYFYQPEYESPEAFEKIYVQATAVLSMPDGTYIKHKDGELEKVRVVSRDCDGCYVLRIRTMCRQCGRVYTNKDSPDGWNCLEHETEIMPSIWMKP